MKQAAGITRAVVVDNVDPEQAGRVRIRPGPDGSKPIERWARLASFSAGPDHGAWFLPEVGDEVLVAFESGEAGEAFVIGALWGGASKPPVADAAGDNAIKVLKTRSGLAVTLDDTAGRESIRIETPGGQSLTLQDGPGSVGVSDSNGNAVRLEAAGITVTSAARLRVAANVIELSAGLVSVEAGMTKFSGVVQCDTLISNSVISPSYTAGQGNLW